MKSRIKISRVARTWIFICHPPLASAVEVGRRYWTAIYERGAGVLPEFALPPQPIAILHAFGIAKL
jgi:hypothetical protein